MVGKAMCRLTKLEVDMGGLVRANEKGHAWQEAEFEQVHRKLDTLVGNSLAESPPMLRVWGNSTGSNDEDIMLPPLCRIVLQNVLPPVSRPVPSPVLPRASSLGPAMEGDGMMVLAGMCTRQEAVEVRTFVFDDIGVVSYGPFRVGCGDIPPVVVPNTDKNEMVSSPWTGACVGCREAESVRVRSICLCFSPNYQIYNVQLVPSCSCPD